MIWKDGLIYSQFYAMNKLQYDVLKYFPWDDDDDTMVLMVLDKGYLEVIRVAMGVKYVDMKVCR